ncbi:Uu.00g026920.m01.CDS01 [Anthostomella pinea]|uniref:Uu.00g026920.m01.CDS01 n=1 Tax=Anthostomella pinea TaxID=933095 RepID=A0AAI8V7H6_9PEZI|nr:Uu.00g026920.m01.CDS01 [Anthostomella pinea]
MSLLQAVFNHVVLPPQVPGCSDADPEGVSRDVALRLLHACNTINALSNPHWSEAFQSLQALLADCLSLNTGRLERSTLLEHYRQLQPGQMLVLHVVEQNAALLIRREESNDRHRVIFEAFETSPAAEKVLAAGHTLQWDFPGRSAQLSFATSSDKSFQESLAIFLEQASMEPIYSLQAVARKANTCVTEERDTTDPALTTQMLMPLLEAMENTSNHLYKKRDFSQNLRGKLSPDLTTTLCAKLSRRMAKLELDRTKIEPASIEPYDSLFAHLGPMVKGAIAESTSQIKVAWESYKRTVTRHIPKLDVRVPDRALRLSLPNSGMYLDRILDRRSSQQRVLGSSSLPEPLDKSVAQIQDFTDHMFLLAKLEMRALDQEQVESSSKSRCEKHCIGLEEEIDNIFSEVDTWYKSDPEQISVMVLALLALWA